MEITIFTLKDLDKFAKKFSAGLKGGEVIALNGELGAGKTAFTKLLLKNLGVKKTVTSPTFVLMIPYRTGKKTLYHLDLYRLEGFKALEAMGIKDLWGRKENILIIEWADKIKRRLPKNTIYINFEIVDNYRKLTIKNAPKSFNN